MINPYFSHPIYCGYGCVYGATRKAGALDPQSGCPRPPKRTTEGAFAGADPHKRVPLAPLVSTTVSTASLRSGVRNAG